MDWAEYDESPRPEPGAFARGVNSRSWSLCEGLNQSPRYLAGAAASRDDSIVALDG